MPDPLKEIDGLKAMEFDDIELPDVMDASHPADWMANHHQGRKHRGPRCEACGVRRNLHAHHVDGKPDNNEKANIQTLCGYCHHFVHETADRLGLPVPGRLPQLPQYELEENA